MPPPPEAEPDLPPPPDRPGEEHPDLASTVPTPRTEPDDMAIDVDVDGDVEPGAAHPAGEPPVVGEEEGKSASPEQLQDFFRQSGSGSPAPADKRSSAPPRPPPSPDRDEEDAPAAAPPAPPDKGKRVTSQGVCDVCGRNPVWSIQHQRWFCEHCQRII